MKFDTREIFRGHYLVRLLEGGGNNINIIEIELTRLIKLKSCDIVTVDLISLDSLNSSVLSVFLTIARNMRKFDTKVSFCNLNKKITQLFKMTAVDKVLDILPGKTVIKNGEVICNVPELRE